MICPKLIVITCWLLVSDPARGTDFTFAIWSDTHFGYNDGLGYRDDSAGDIATLVGTAYPPEIGGVVGTIEFLLHTGDITANTRYREYEDDDGMC